VEKRAEHIDSISSQTDRLKAFNICSQCQMSWYQRNDFIESPSIKLIGYQADFNEPTDGLFLFNHQVEECGVIMGVRVEKFIDLYTGPFYPDLKKDSDKCCSYCLDNMNLDPCDEPCSMAYIRSIIQTIKKKQNNA